MSSAKHIRFFISSTFADMDRERDLLVNKILPDISYDYSAQGWVIDWVDFRWGLAKKEAVKHTTMDICLNALQHCKDINSDAFMITLLGQRYGWIPLPERLTKEIRQIFKLCGDGKLIDKIYRFNENDLSNEVYYPHWKFWHKKDEHYARPVWTMKPLEEIDGGEQTIENAFGEFNFLADQLMKRKMAHGTFGANGIKNLFSSATEKEINKGFLYDRHDADSVVVYKRTLSDIPEDYKAVYNPEEGRQRQVELVEQVTDVIDKDNSVWFDGNFAWYQSEDWEKLFIKHIDRRLRYVIDKAIANYKEVKTEPHLYSDIEFEKFDYPETIEALREYLKNNKRSLTKNQWCKVENLLRRAELTPVYIELLSHYLCSVNSWDELPELPEKTIGMVSFMIDWVRLKTNYPEFLMRVFITAIAMQKDGITSKSLKDLLEAVPQIESLLRSWNVRVSNGCVPLSIIIRMSIELSSLVYEAESRHDSVLKFHKALGRECVLALSKTWPSPVEGVPLYDFIYDFGIHD